ncbi:hypothetical protein HK099_004033 [Clydaea vesicula]|uniref:Uncharacterized protein n=1 Tax=Clydaea vesicula TaxID=447962 RepID=A0AAD5U5G4_9FUNG|nr:hypothetical protein HK099_004033 [Clydaea vesicula]
MSITQIEKLFNIQNIEIKKLFKQQEDNVTSLFKEQEDNITSLRKDILRLDKDIRRLDLNSGFNREFLLRQAVSRLFGDSFAKSFQVRCLDNIIHLIAKSGVFRREDDISYLRLDKTNLLAHSLLDADIPRQLFNHCLECIKHRNGDVYKKYEDITSTEPQIIGRLLARIYELIEMYKSLITKPSIDARLKYLRSKKGPGISLVIFAANEKFFYDNPNRLPERYLDFDVRGNIEIVDDSARISVGEVKTAPEEFGHAKSQLKIRLQVLKWAIEKVVPNVKQFFL